MAVQYYLEVEEVEGLIRAEFNLALVSVPGFPDGQPSNNNAAINKAKAWVDYHNTHLLPHEPHYRMHCVKRANKDFSIIWNEFTN